MKNDFIQIKDYYIALNKVTCIDFSYDNEDYTIQFQFEDNFLLIYFDDENDFNYWLSYLRGKI